LILNFDKIGSPAEVDWQGFFWDYFPFPFPLGGAA
jgi:hypothetical protein